MKVIMVKKRLRSGEECPRCTDATEYLKKKGVFDRLHAVVWYDESTPDDEGHRLAKLHKVERAPFFIVERPGREPEMIDSPMRIYKLL